MRRFWLIPVCCAALLIPCVAVVAAAGGKGGFEGVVQSIEARYHVHANRIPFLGIISIISRKATEGGVNGVHVAEFDNFHSNVDGEELNRMVEEKLGQGWDRIIRETSRTGTQQTLIFMHPEGRMMGLFVVDLDGKEMDVVEVSVDADHLKDSIKKYDHHHHDGDKDDDSGDDSE